MIGAIGYSEYLVRRTASLLRNINGTPREPLLVGTDHSATSIDTDFITTTKKEVLENKKIHIVYVSSATGNHYQDCVAALDHGKHVLVEKPICLGVKELMKIEAIAQRHNLIVAECLSYSFHPRWRHMLSEFNMYYQQENVHLRAVFTIPHRSADDFRYRPEHGGIAADLGTYIIDSFLQAGIKQSQLESSSGIIDADSHSGYIRTGGEPSGEAHWAIGEIYQNTFTVIGKSFQMNLKRAFSPPVDQATTLTTTRVNNNSDPTELEFSPCNATQLCLDNALNEIRSHRIGVVGAPRIRRRIGIMERIIREGFVAYE
ncbi:Gfo/Idh/MocA family protein [Propionibacterium acidifaciens]|uniref:Gfo/Idh/MocA family protein n=1 Tax=Propionibacterium acidifaciens TaxID=556499 RepID=UPI0009DC37EF|nr:Gfo/Idh/MocA family oxidoreductase [Propionibacterium acidifaciens]